MNRIMDEIEADTLLRDITGFVKAAPCSCTPLFDDQPDGPMFGPSCERCALLERILSYEADTEQHRQEGAGA